MIQEKEEKNIKMFTTTMEIFSQCKANGKHGYSINMLFFQKFTSVA